ncbi:MAG: superoxide dismutase [Syntrophobacterales bacterium]|nr:superoxide dismutase [Syntrophobacterales bacterium]
MQQVKSYEAKDYSHLIGMPGLTETALRLHFSLYQGYVNNTNKLLEEMKTLAEQGMANTPQYAELKRRFSFEFNGMKLHELFFENLGVTPSALSPNSSLYKALEASFGSFDSWQKDFIATAQIRGIGWAVLFYDPSAGRLMNAWINEHHVGLLSQCIPLLVLDVFEHAFIVDYQLDRASYIKAVMQQINWKVVETRFEGKQAM